MSQAEPSLFTFLLAFAPLNSQQRDQSALLTSFWIFSSPLLQTLPHSSHKSLLRAYIHSEYILLHSEVYHSNSPMPLNLFSVSAACPGCCGKALEDSNSMKALDWFKFCFVVYGLWFITVCCDRESNMTRIALSHGRMSLLVTLGVQSRSREGQMLYIASSSFPFHWIPGSSQGKRYHPAQSGSSLPS